MYTIAPKRETDNIRASLPKCSPEHFKRQCCIIWTVQMLAISAVSSIELFSAAFKEWMNERPALIFISIGIISNAELALKKRHSSATCLLIASGLTLLETYTISAICSMFETSIVLSAVVLTAGIFVFVTALACLTKYDFTPCLPYLFGGLLGLILLGFTVAFYPVDSINKIVYGGMAAFIFSGYILLVARLVLHRHYVKRVLNVTILLFLNSHLEWQSQREEIREFISSNIEDNVEDVELACMWRKKRVLLDDQAALPRKWLTYDEQSQEFGVEWELRKE